MVYGEEKRGDGITAVWFGNRIHNGCAGCIGHTLPDESVAGHRVDGVSYGVADGDNDGVSTFNDCVIGEVRSVAPDQTVRSKGVCC